MSAVQCTAIVFVSIGREVRCAKPAGHGPVEDLHQGLVRVTLPDGREHAASLVWSSTPSPWEDEILRRST